MGKREYEQRTDEKFAETVVNTKYGVLYTIYSGCTMTKTTIYSKPIKQRFPLIRNSDSIGSVEEVIKIIQYGVTSIADTFVSKKEFHQYKVKSQESLETKCIQLYQNDIVFIPKANINKYFPLGTILNEKMDIECTRPYDSKFQFMIVGHEYKNKKWWQFWITRRKRWIGDRLTVIERNDNDR